MLGGGGLVAEERDARQPELVPDGGQIVLTVPADDRHFAVGHSLPGQGLDGCRHLLGLVRPGGGLPEGEPGFAGGGRVLQLAGKQPVQPGKVRRFAVAEVGIQHQGRSHRHAVFAGQLAQGCRQLLGPAEQAEAPFIVLQSVAAKGHRYILGHGEHGLQQAALGGVEGIEFVDKHRASGEEVRLQRFGRRQHPVARVHGRALQQCLVGGEDTRQLAQLTAAVAGVLGQFFQLPGTETGALEFVQGLGAFFAEGRAAPVAAVVHQIRPHGLQRPAHQHRPARVGEGTHRRAAVGLQNILRQAGEAVAGHIAGQLVSQQLIQPPLGGGGELLGHDEHALFPCQRPSADGL